MTVSLLFWSFYYLRVFGVGGWVKGKKMINIGGPLIDPIKGPPIVTIKNVKKVIIGRPSIFFGHNEGLPIKTIKKCQKM